MAQRTERVTCPRCGANNFDTVSNCWKCGAPLSIAPTVSPPIGSSSPYSAPPSPFTGANSESATYTPAAPVYLPASGGDPGVARRAAIALALTIPWIGLPIGWVFMMMEDSRRQAIGRVCAVWSMIALVFHTLLLMLALKSLGPVMNFALQAATDAGRRAAAPPQEQ